MTTRLSEEFGDDVDVVLIDKERRICLRVLEARPRRLVSGVNPLRLVDLDVGCLHVGADLFAKF